MARARLKEQKARRPKALRETATPQERELNSDPLGSTFNSAASSSPLDQPDVDAGLASASPQLDQVHDALAPQPLTQTTVPAADHYQEQLPAIEPQVAPASGASSLHGCPARAKAELGELARICGDSLFTPSSCVVSRIQQAPMPGIATSLEERSRGTRSLAERSLCAGTTVSPEARAGGERKTPLRSSSVKKYVNLYTICNQTLQGERPSLAPNSCRSHSG